MAIQKSVNLLCLRMQDSEAFQGATHVCHLGGRVHTSRPFNQRRVGSLKRHIAIFRDGNLPRKISTAHGSRRPAFWWPHGAGGLHILSASNPGHKPGLGAAKGIQGKPTRMFRCRRIWIDCDYFQVNTFSQAQQPIVRAHQGMFSTGRHLNAEYFLYIIHSFLECRCGNGKVVYLEFRG